MIVVSDLHDKKDVKGDGTIILHKRERRDGTILPTWYMRIRIPLPDSRGYIRQSTNTTDLNRATQIAYNKFDELYSKIQSGGTLETITFKKLYEKFCDKFPQAPKNVNRRKKYVDNCMKQLGRYPYDYFVKELNNIDIEKITTKHIQDYFSYQMKNSYRNGMRVEPSLNTIHKYGVALRTIFKFAVQEKYINTEPLIETPAFKDEKRPVFERNEWRVLTNGMGKYVEDSRQSNHYRDRYYLQHYILISSNCGARVGELRELKWRDIREEIINKRKVLYATVLGKTGEREMVFQPVCETYFDRLKTFRIDELGKSVSPKEYIFCKKDGSPIQSFRKSYDRLLKNLNLQFNNRGNKRTIYSLRHTYATFRLEDEVNPHLLARQMGTSVKMLEEHYGQTRGKLVAQQITKTSSQRTIPTSLVDELYSSKTDTE